MAGMLASADITCLGTVQWFPITAVCMTELHIMVSPRMPLLAIPEVPIKAAPAMAVPEVSASAVTECPVSASPPLSLASGVWVVPQCLCILRGCQTLVASGSLVWGSDICIWQYYCLSGDHICKCNVNRVENIYYKTIIIYCIYYTNVVLQD